MTKIDFENGETVRNTPPTPYGGLQKVIKRNHLKFISPKY